MEIFWRLVLGHLIADFTLQTNFIAGWKRKSTWGLFVHCAIHPLLYTLLLWNYLGQVWVQIGGVALTGYVCVLIVFVAHFIEDHWRIWSVLTKGSPDNTFFYFLDQMVHYAVIFAVAPAIDGHLGKYGFLVYPPITGVLSAAEAQGLNLWQRFFTIVHPEKWVYIAILVTIVTHFTTVTIYFVEKDLMGSDFPGDKEKYISIFERLIIMACFFLPGKWWILVVVFWVFRSGIYKVKNIYRFSWYHIIIGNCTAILCGILGRLILRS